MADRHAGRLACSSLITWVTQPTKRRAVGPVLVLLAVDQRHLLPAVLEQDRGRDAVTTRSSSPLDRLS